MKNKFCVFVILFMTAAFILTINFVAATSGDLCHPVISLMNQDPNPAEPGSYVRVVFGVSGLENPNCEGMAVKLLSSYPFSLDSGDNGIRSLEGSTYTLGYKSNWNVPYNIRIADDALEGDYQLRLYSKTGAKLDFDSGYAQNTFTLTLTDAQTDFDTVIQGTSGNQVSIGIVNTGKNTANSLVVGIPQQESFTTTGTNQQIIGNLAVGDYTIVSFNILPKNFGAGLGNTSRENRGTANGAPPFNLTRSTPPIGEQTLKVKIDYTDGIGKRRNITKEIMFDNSLLSSNFTGRSGTGQTTSKTPSTILGMSSSYVYFAGIIIIIIAAILIYKKYKNRSQDKKGKHDKNSGTLPDWITEKINKK